MSNKFLYDSIDSCLKVINGDIETTRNTGKIYRNTNEVLTSIIRPELIKDKEVLSVMASSDQVFSAYYSGAKSVDTFDYNILAYYYYFLKKWSLLQTGKHYISANNKDLEICIELHDNTLEERRAYIFWKEVLKNIKSSLYYSELFHKPSIWWNVPYQNDEDTMKHIIQDKHPSFTKLNLFKPIDIPKQYDVIILSNILEYIYDEDDDSKYYELSRIVNENLKTLLKPNGIAISSNILDYDYKGNSILEHGFIYEEGPTGLSPRFNKEVPLSYTLKKR